MQDFTIAVFEGDGIGPEIMAPTVALLQGMSDASSAYRLHFEVVPGGAGHYRRYGEALPETSLARARAADAILLSAIGLPDVRYPDGTEIVAQIDLRIALGLYAGVRPVRLRPGLPSPLVPRPGPPVDFVLVRESTEGLFHSMGAGVVTEEDATETLRITRATSEKLFAFAFRLAARRKLLGRGPGRVTCIDKANVFRAFAFFREVFDGVARQHPEVAADRAYVDAAAMWMVTQPERFDVMVTENMFGDILSDLGAGLMGGLGCAPSADIGDDHAVFQPCHGTAPDIAGRGVANPLAMILSAAMMLEWLAERSGMCAVSQDSARLEAAVERVLRAGCVRTPDLGGAASTLDMVEAVSDALAESMHPAQ